MGIVLDYIQEIKADVISVLNQVRICKKMILPCELVEFLGMRKTRKQEKKK